MPRKPKFRPRITRVKLNPEQTVLWCNCYSAGRSLTPYSRQYNPSAGKQLRQYCVIGYKAGVKSALAYDYSPGNWELVMEPTFFPSGASS